MYESVIARYSSFMLLCSNIHQVTIEMVNALYDFGNFQYSCGNYAAAADLLYQFRVLSTDNDKVSAATWGKFASEILTTNWEGSVEELQKVKEQRLPAPPPLHTRQHTTGDSSNAEAYPN